MVLPLVLIPKIDAKAYYPYLGDFTHTYDSQNFYFDFVNESDIPQDIQIASSIFDSVIQAELSMDSMRIAQQGYIISSLSNYAADMTSLLYNFALSSLDAVYQGLIDQDHSCLKWSVIYNGSVGTNRYNWTFSCPLGSQNITLGADGLLPHPSDHTYTSHDDQAIADLVDDQIIDNNVYIPSGYTYGWNDYKAPFFKGSYLYFYLYNQGVPTLYHFDQPMYNTAIMTTYHDYAGSGSYNVPLLCFISPLTNSNTSWHLIDSAGNYLYWSGSFKQSRTSQFNYNDKIFTGTLYGFYFSSTSFNMNYPNYYHANPFQYVNVVTFDYSNYNTIGFQNNSRVSGSGNALFLYKKTVDTVTNPDDIIIPIDEPLPVDPIITWPDDNLPEDDPDGDPTPVTPYDPEPINPVVPLPPIPSVVSGNDDLWPDLNDYFDTEDNIIDFTFPAVNVEFPDLSILLGNFVNSFTWVSTIITALFNGSDFSVLFSVLAFFFIAAAVLGIYKWWK